MRKLLKIAIFLCLSLSSLAMLNLNSGELEYKENSFYTKTGKLIEGNFELSNDKGQADFFFEKGKLVEFEYDSKGKENLEIEGYFIEDNKYFQGEVSVELVIKQSAEETEKQEVDLEGKIESQNIFEFAKNLLSQKNSKEPNFLEVKTWKVDAGKKELETKVVTKISKETDGETYLSYQVKEEKEKEVFSNGKLIHTSSSSSSQIESRREKL